LGPCSRSTAANVLTTGIFDVLNQRTDCCQYYVSARGTLEPFPSSNRRRHEFDMLPSSQVLVTGLSPEDRLCVSATLATTPPARSFDCISWPLCSPVLLQALLLLYSSPCRTSRPRCLIMVGQLLHKIDLCNCGETGNVCRCQAAHSRWPGSPSSAAAYAVLVPSSNLALFTGKPQHRPPGLGSTFCGLTTPSQLTPGIVRCGPLPADSWLL